MYFKLNIEISAAKIRHFLQWDSLSQKLMIFRKKGHLQEIAKIKKRAKSKKKMLIPPDNYACMASSTAW